MKIGFVCAENSVGIKHCLRVARMAAEQIEKCFRCMEFFKLPMKKYITRTVNIFIPEIELSAYKYHLDY